MADTRVSDEIEDHFRRRYGLTVSFYGKAGFEITKNGATRFITIPEFYQAMMRGEEHVKALLTTVETEPTTTKLARMFDQKVRGQIRSDSPALSWIKKRR